MDRHIHRLPPDVFESLVDALARALVDEYRARWDRHEPNIDRPAVSASSTWLTLRDASARAKCGAATLRREVRTGRLRAARVGGRRALRFRAEWIDGWLQASVSPTEGNRAPKQSGSRR